MTPLHQILAAFVIATGCCLYIYFAHAKFITRVFTESKWFRRVIRVLSICLFPLLLGAWSDLIDLTKLSSQQIVDQYGWSMCFAVTLPIFVLLNVLIFSAEDQHIEAKAANDELLRDLETREKAAINQVDVQTRLIVATSKAVAAYRSSIGRALKEIQSRPEGIKKLVSEMNPITTAGWKLAEGVRMALEKTLPSNAKSIVALFVEENGRLVPLFSSDGITDNIVDEFIAADPGRFLLNGDDKDSSARQAALSNCIIVDAETEESHQDDERPFRFLGRGELLKKQKRMIKSLVSVPIVLDPVSRKMSVLCVSASINGAVGKEEFSWFVEMIKDHLEPRFQLLFQQSALFREFGNIPEKLEERFKVQYEGLLNSRIAAKTADLRQEIRELEEQLGVVNEQNRTALTKNNELAEQLLDSRQSVDSLRLELAKKKKQVTALKGQVTKLEKKIPK